MTQQWISVKERLPEETGDYWVYRIEKDGWVAPAPMTTRRFDATHKRWLTETEVTHWMPLPPAPEGEK